MQHKGEKIILPTQRKWKTRREVSDPYDFIGQFNGTVDEYRFGLL